MSHQSLAYINALTPEKVQEVIDDIRLMQKGYQLYYAVDPYEIFDFCFPINPRKNLNRDIESIADDQAALYYVFFGRRNRPVLLRDYVSEVRGLVMLFQRELEDAYKQTAMVNALMREGGLDEIEQDPSMTGEEDLLSIVSKKFNIILAVIMGMYSLGVQRLQTIYYQRLLPAWEDSVFADGLKDYQPTDLVQNIFQYCVANSKPRNDRSEEERMHRAFYNDARAIDRMIHLDARLQEKRLMVSEPRRVVLYLSSVDRTRRVFREEIPIDRLPVVEGKAYSIYRDRSQLFTYLVHKSRVHDLNESIENLEKVKKSLKEIEGLSRKPFDYCSQCILDDKTPQFCERLQICEAEQAMYSAIQDRRAEVRNLGLTTSLDDYQRLLEAKPKDESQAKLVDFFRHVFESGIRDVAAEKMLRQQQLVLMQCATSAMSFHPHTYVREEHLRAGRDFIVGTVQYLPVKPKVEDPKYALILELIVSFYKTPPQGDEKKVELINRAYSLYCAIDSSKNDLDPEHELVRCLIYLAFPSTKGDRLAYEHAGEMLSQAELIESKPYTEREYRYVQCWAARRIRNFSAARDIANLAVSKWPDDARFYHGRSLNGIAWVQDRESTADKDVLLDDAVRDIRKAIELYGRGEHGNKELIAASYNTLAYLLALKAFNSQDKPGYAMVCVTEAREALNRLKTWVRPNDWKPNHPEYFHTEAYVEYQEFLAHRNDWSLEDQSAKLRNARAALREALRLDPKRKLYTDLESEIEEALGFFS